LLVAAVAVLIVGCGDVGSGPPADVVPTLDNIWPNEDTRFWRYDLRSSQWMNPDSTYIDPDCDSVPPAPGFPKIIQRLALQPDSSESRAGGYRLQFAGMDTTESGRIGQALRGDTLAPVAASTQVKHPRPLP
jgi:hypothetical protein